MFLDLESELVGVGKSSLAYTAPLPIVAFAPDAGVVRSLYGSRWKLWEGVDIEIRDYPVVDIDGEELIWARNNGKAITVYLLPKLMQVGLRPQGVAAMWSYFIRLYRKALNSAFVNSVVIDTATLLRNIGRDTYLEGLPANRISLIQIEYGKPNGMLRDVYTDGQAIVEKYAREPRQKHLIITHHMEEEYASRLDSSGQMQSWIVMDPATGKNVYQTAGLKDTPRFIDVSLKLSVSMQPDPFNSGQKIQVFESEFLKCGFDGSLRGQKIVTGTWDSLVDVINKNIHPMAHVQKRGF